jgi:hypothetical protein
MPDILKQMERVAEWQEHYMGLQEMNIAVLDWLLQHQREVSPVMLGLISHMEAKLATARASRPTVDGLPDLKVV